MKIVDIANAIFENLGRPSDTSVPAIAFWVRSQTGAINNLLNEDFQVNSAYEIIDGNGDEISIDAVAVIESLYAIHKYSLDIKVNINSLSTDSIVEVSDQGSSVRKVNKNEVAKTIVQLRKDVMTELSDQVKGYKTNKAVPAQIAGDDTEEGIYPSLSIQLARRRHHAT
jgi:hypothetical protein